MQPRLSTSVEVFRCNHCFFLFQAVECGPNLVCTVPFFLLRCPICGVPQVGKEVQSLIPCPPVSLAASIFLRQPRLLLLNITKLVLVLGYLCFSEWVLGSNTPSLLLLCTDHLLGVTLGHSPWDALPQTTWPTSADKPRVEEPEGGSPWLKGLVIGSLSGLALSRGHNEMMWRL